MIEDFKNSVNDDFSGFEDYLAEFDSTIGFDAETCEVCGVNISGSVSVQNSPFIRHKTVSEESELFSYLNELKSKCITFKIEKRLNTEMTDRISYIFDILIPLKFIPDLNKIE